jgi:hypothetical protein
MKEIYIEMRNKKQIDINWFYEYYIQNSKHNISIENFYQTFMFANIEAVMEYIDKKFELIKLLDKNGEFIKIVE